MLFLSCEYFSDYKYSIPHIFSVSRLFLSGMNKRRGRDNNTSSNGGVTVNFGKSRKMEANSVIKGCQKKIIHITNTGSPFFEEAYFILRHTGDGPDCINGDDMVREAMRIACETSKSVAPSARRRRRSRGTMLLLGASVCSLLFGIVMLIFVLGTQYA